MTDEKTAEIKKTFNYDQFKIMYGNRDINKTRVAHIIDSIKKNNLLCYEPILVNTKKEVIDGQHRLKAAEKLKVAIYYIMGENTVLEDIILLNAYNKNWISLDYLNFYIKMGKPDYKIIKKFMEKYHISASMATGCLTMTFNTMGGNMKAFKEGTLIVTHEEEATMLLEEILSLKNEYFFTKENAFQDREFVKAYTIMRQQVQFEDFKAKLSNNNLKIERQGSKKNYVRHLEDLLNFKNKKGKALRLY